MDATQSEQWRPVVGYEGRYEVSDFGRIRTVARIAPWGTTTRRVDSKIRKPYPAPNGGHLVLGLHLDHQVTNVYVHRVVLEAFVGPCPDGMEACHLDDDPTNNHLSNLRWDTRSGNLRDRYRNGCVHFNREKTQCVHGHELSGDNLIILKNGKRRCRTCDLRTQAQTRARRRARKAAAQP